MEMLVAVEWHGIPWAGVGAVLLGLGSFLSGLGAYMTARKKADERPAGSSDNERIADGPGVGLPGSHGAGTGSSAAREDGDD